MYERKRRSHEKRAKKHIETLHNEIVDLALSVKSEFDVTAVLGADEVMLSFKTVELTPSQLRSLAVSVEMMTRRYAGIRHLKAMDYNMIGNDYVIFSSNLQFDWRKK